MRSGIRTPTGRRSSAKSPPGVWYHLAVVYDKDAPRDHVKVSINGRLEEMGYPADSSSRSWSDRLRE